MRRTSLLLCVLAVVALVAMVFPAYAAVELFRVGVENPTGDPVPQAPAYINYTLNCTADILIDILPSDSAGVPTGAPAIRSDTLYAQAKGKHIFLWPCTDTAGGLAPQGFYVARITATPTATRWDANIGLYKNWEIAPPAHEWPYRDSADAVALPADTAHSPGYDETISGFYGIGVNHRVDSPYYGRMYVTHNTYRHIYMYDVDGTYLGYMDDGAVSWMTSAPWDLSIADDDYVYVSDRSAMYLYCFAPDGTFKSKSTVQQTNDRAIFARTDASTGVTYIFCSSGTHVYQMSVNADHMIWNPRTSPGMNLGSGADPTIYGMWVSQDLKTMYLCSMAGTWTGVRKYTRTSITGNWAHVTTWSALSGTGCIDVELSPDESYMWVTVNRAAAPCIYKIQTSNGAVLASHDIISWGFMLSRDAVGNVAVTFGKSVASWPGKYWGMFAEPTTVATTKTTSVFQLGADPAPVVVPGSETWSFSDPFGGDMLTPNGVDTATVTFRVLDPNGYSDIGAITMDLKELKNTSATDTIQAPDTITPDPMDPMSAVITKTVTAVNGVQFGAREIIVTATDSNTTKLGGGKLYVQVASNTLGAYVKHTRSGATVTGATMVAVGGKVGVYGYPFTYESQYSSDATGYVSMPISEGTFAVTAVRPGFKTQAPQTQIVSAVTPTPGVLVIMPANLMLGPLSIAEARLLTNQVMYCSVEGLVYAQPRGVNLATQAVTAYGMDDLMRVFTSTTEYVFARTWYMCDATAPAEGMMFQLKRPDATFNRQWDDSTKKDIITGNSLYIGKRPANGDTICVAGLLYTTSGYETRLLLDDSLLNTLSYTRYKEVFYNCSQDGTVPNQALPTPVVTSNVNDIYHINNTPYEAKWGKYARLTGVTPVKWYADGRFAPDNGIFPAESITVPANPVRYVTVVDSLGRWGTVSFSGATSYGMPTAPDVCPVTIGDTYTFTGACGRRARFGEGTLRVLGTAGITRTTTNTYPAANTVGIVRGLGTGSVNFRGVVTAKFTDSFYVESTDRSVGIKVAQSPWWVSEGDDVVVTGNIMITAGVKQIIPTTPVVVVSSGNAIPQLGIRHKDIGGKDYGTNDPGITNGRGPLNVGLFVTVQGMVSYRDTTGAAPFFYIWDGSNMYITGESDPRPIDDGTGNRGIRIKHNGWMVAPVVPVARALKQWQDFVTIKGVVSVDTTAVPGSSIPVIIPTTITVETAFDTMADAGANLKIGANLFALPASPAGTGNGADPALGTNPMPWDVPTVFAPYDTADTTLGQIYRFEIGNLSLYGYDVWLPETFGGMIMSDGYWMYLTEDWPVSYKAKKLNIPQWMAIPNPGEAWIGLPQATPLDLEQIKVHDGAQVVTFEVASQWGLNWLQSTGFYWDSITQSMCDIGLPADWAGYGTAMEPWRGYLFTINEPDKAWIMPYVP